MNNLSVEKSLKKSNNVLEQKRKSVKQTFFAKKTYRITLIAANFVREQLKIPEITKKKTRYKVFVLPEHTPLGL